MMASMDMLRKRVLDWMHTRYLRKGANYTFIAHQVSVDTGIVAQNVGRVLRLMIDNGDPVCCPYHGTSRCRYQTKFEGIEGVLG